MSNKITFKKNWLSQNLDFLSLKNLCPGQFVSCVMIRFLTCKGFIECISWPYEI